MRFGCAIARRHVIAWNDGELRGLTLRLLRSHFSSCETCRVEAEAWAKEHQRQAAAFGALFPLSSAPIDEQWACIEWRLGHENPRCGRRGFGLLRLPSRPRTLAVAAAVAAVLFASWKLAGVPQGVLLALGIKPPPVEVVRMPELFRDYAVVEELDLLEHLDTLGANEPTDPETAPNG